MKTALALGVTLVCWSWAFAGIRVGLQGYQPHELALLRLAVAGPILVGYAAAIRLRLPDLRDLPRLVLAGLFSLVLYQLALNSGERTLDAGAAALLVNASPIFTVVLAGVFLRERLAAAG